MASNFLYMFEFFVDYLLITKPNGCAPEEYPTCVEISFRSSVFVCICDREFNRCVNLCGPKCCKCCLFSLQSPVKDKERVQVHVYKKKDEKCKFLEGAADLSVKLLFDKVTESFHDTNPYWLENLSKFMERLPDSNSPKKKINNDCFTCNVCDMAARPEQFCPTNIIAKRLLPLYNMNGLQTGNLSLIIRLVCNGPAIVSSYPFSKLCKTVCPPDKPLRGGNCATCASWNPSPARAITDYRKHDNGHCVQPDPCKRYFACNLEKGSPCSDCEDYCDRDCQTGCAKEEANSKCLRCCSACPSRSSRPCCPSMKHASTANSSPKPPPKPELCGFTKGSNDCCCKDCQQHIETSNA